MPGIPCFPIWTLRVRLTGQLNLGAYYSELHVTLTDTGRGPKASSSCAFFFLSPSTLWKFRSSSQASVKLCG